MPQDQDHSSAQVIKSATHLCPMDTSPSPCNKAWAEWEAEWEAWAACLGWVAVTSAAFQACLLLQRGHVSGIGAQPSRSAWNHEASVEWAWARWAE